MKIDVIGSNSLLFANLPPASQVPGRTYRVSDVGPAPGILLTSDGTKYRPAGGRQVLAMRGTSSVVYQNTSLGPVESLGQFPGGLVRMGMRVEVNLEASLSGVGTAPRTIRLWVGPAGAPVLAGQFFFFQNSASGTAEIKINAYVRAVADGSANHIGSPYSTGVPSALAGGTLAPTALSTPNTDFSAPWGLWVYGSSGAETPVNISSATWAGGIATFNTSAPHTLAVGDKTVIASVTPTGWNIPAGAIVLTVPTTTQFTVALAADPGAYTSGGTSSRISNVISQSYVLELVG